MDDLFDAIRQAIYDYTHMDELNPRRQRTLNEVYSKVVYTPEKIDSLLSGEEEGESSEEE